MHMEVLVATDCFTPAVWTWSGLVTDDILCCIRINTREVHVAGVTPPPHEHWMRQVARTVTMTDWGVLGPGQYLIHERDTTGCSACQATSEAAGVKRVVLPARSPNLNAYAERWVRSV
jgi:putative transposase